MNGTWNCTCNFTIARDKPVEDVLNILYYTFMITMSVLSMIGSVTLSFVIIKYDQNSNSRRLLIYLSGSDFVMALFNILGVLW